MLEASASMAIAMLLIVTFHSSMVSLKRLETTVEAQNRGLVVLANVVERLEARSDVTADVAERVLTEEFNHSGFGGSKHYAPRCSPATQGFGLSIVDPDGKVLVAVKVGP